MQALSMRELCERWAEELDRQPRDVARTLVSYLLREPDDERALPYGLIPPASGLPPDPREDPGGIPPIPTDLIEVQLHEIVHEGRALNWGLLELIVITASDLRRWLATTHALPLPRFWFASLPNEDASRDDADAVGEAGGLDDAPSPNAVLKALAVITMALAQGHTKYWKAGNRINVSTVVDQTLKYLEANDDVKVRFGGRGLSTTTLSNALTAALRQTS